LNSHEGRGEDFQRLGDMDEDAACGRAWTFSETTDFFKSLPFFIQPLKITTHL